MPRARLGRRNVDLPRRIAFRVLRAVTGDGAYANLETGRQLTEHRLEARDAAFVTELVSGTCRLQGTYDRVLTAASGRPASGLSPEVLDVLRLGAHQVLSMRVPTHAAVAASVELAGAEVGEKVVGLTNAILRKVAARDLAGWVEVLSAGEDAVGALATRTHHPRWIAQAHVDLLGDEAEAALAANNVTPVPTLVVRPGLAEVGDLGGEPTRWSPYGARRPGNPGEVPAVRSGRAGVQDEGSQLVALALAHVAATGPWLDLCAGPGGKSALLAGLAAPRGERLVAAEVQPHRATLVQQALRAYRADPRPLTLCADGTRPAWPDGTFGHVLADVPCTGLGALRRRPESRWRRRERDLEVLVPLQQRLLAAALASAAPGGVVAYVTCSPHARETTGVVRTVLARTDRRVEVLDAAAHLPGVPDAALGDFVQLWPHRHGTDAMFLALLRVGGD